MKIAADTNQFNGIHLKNHVLKHAQIEELGGSVHKLPLPFGDYCLITRQMEETIIRRGSKLKKADLIADIKCSIDTKKDIQEVCGNLCGKAHARFRDEAILAQKMGAKFIVLIEDGAFKSIDDVEKWQNPRAQWYYMQKARQAKGFKAKLPKAPPTSGKTLAKAMRSMSEKYNIEWQFCNAQDTGARIIDILAGVNDE